MASALTIRQQASALRADLTVLRIQHTRLKSDLVVVLANARAAITRDVGAVFEKTAAAAEKAREREDQMRGKYRSAFEGLRRKEQLAMSRFAELTSSSTGACNALQESLLANHQQVLDGVHREIARCQLPSCSALVEAVRAELAEVEYALEECSRLCLERVIQAATQIQSLQARNTAVAREMTALQQAATADATKLSSTLTALDEVQTAHAAKTAEALALASGVSRLETTLEASALQIAALTGQLHESRTHTSALEREAAEGRDAFAAQALAAAAATRVVALERDAASAQQRRVVARARELLVAQFSLVAASAAGCAAGGGAGSSAAGLFPSPVPECVVALGLNVASNDDPVASVLRARLEDAARACQEAQRFLHGGHSAGSSSIGFSSRKVASRRRGARGDLRRGFDPSESPAAESMLSLRSAGPDDIAAAHARLAAVADEMIAVKCSSDALTRPRIDASREAAWQPPQTAAAAAAAESPTA